jgi:hypothetical protein
VNSSAQACGINQTCGTAAFCPFGFRVTGGGFNVGLGGGVQILASQPITGVTFDMWLVQIRNSGTASISFQAWAVCVDTIQ